MIVTDIVKKLEKEAPSFPHQETSSNIPDKQNEEAGSEKKKKLVLTGQVCYSKEEERAAAD